MAGRPFYLYEKVGARYYVHIFRGPRHATAWVKVHGSPNPERFKTRSYGRIGRGTYDHRGEIDYKTDDELVRMADAEEEAVFTREEVDAITFDPLEPLAF